MWEIVIFYRTFNFWQRKFSIIYRQKTFSAKIWEYLASWVLEWWNFIFLSFLVFDRFFRSSYHRVQFWKLWKNLTFFTLKYPISNGRNWKKCFFSKSVLSNLTKNKKNLKTFLPNFVRYLEFRGQRQDFVFFKNI
jgi:hypothetical protein